jgi:ABC-type sulfate transport system permease component
VQATAEHYGITLADVYGAMAFYYDNHDAIQNAIQEARQIGESLGATSAKSALDAIRQRE